MRTRTGRRAGARAPEKRFLINGHRADGDADPGDVVLHPFCAGGAGGEGQQAKEAKNGESHAHRMWDHVTEGIRGLQAPRKMCKSAD